MKTNICKLCPWKYKLTEGTGPMEGKTYCPVSCSFPVNNGCSEMRYLIRLAEAGCAEVKRTQKDTSVRLYSAALEYQAHI